MCVKIDEVSKLNIRETSMQNLNFFLNKNDALKIDLINYILENDFNSYDMRQLETEFSISDYMLKETIDSLNIDLRNQLHFEWLFIEKGIVYQQYLMTRYHLYKIAKYYFSLSPLKIILEQRILIGDFPKYTAMQAEYGWSTSYFFSQRNQLINLVEDQSSFTYIQFVYTSFTYFDSVPNFSERVHNISNEILTFLFKKQLIDKRRYEHEKLLIEICVSEILNNEHNLFSHAKSETNLLIQTDQFLPKKILSLIGTSESNYLIVLLSVLDSFDFLNITDQYSYTNQKAINQIDKLIHPLVSSFFDTFDDETIDRLSMNIACYTQRFSQKSQWVFSLEGQVSISYFRDIFPSVVCFSERLVEQINKHGELILSKYLNFYLFNIISIMYEEITSSKVDAVKINVSFSATELTNEMISSMLKNHINHASVSFIKNTKNADIYLSDTINDDVTGEQVIWKKPPIISDWKALGELIISIKQNGKKIF